MGKLLQADIDSSCQTSSMKGTYHYSCPNQSACLRGGSWKYLAYCNLFHLNKTGAGTGLHDINSTTTCALAPANYSPIIYVPTKTF
jgi:hypothetical protein